MAITLQEFKSVAIIHQKLNKLILCQCFRKLIVPFLSFNAIQIDFKTIDCKPVHHIYMVSFE